jgi:hypothetical protein
MLIPWTVVKPVTHQIGLGVFATRAIPAGTLIWVEDCLDRRIPIEEFRRLRAPLLEHAYTHAYIPCGANYYLLCWDGAKFMNHSCAPNCLSVAAGVEIAAADIRAGEQMTCDYSGYGLEEWEKFECRCGAPACCGVVATQTRPDAKREQAALTAQALHRAAWVEQPLAFLLSDEQLPHHRMTPPRQRASQAGTLRFSFGA